MFEYNQLKRYLPRSLRLLVSLARARRVNEAMIVYHFLQRGPIARVMVDVGAAHGSLLIPYAGDGWTVYAFEPNPGTRGALERRMRRYPRVIIDGRAVSNRDGDRVPYFSSGVSEGIGTLAPFDPSHRKTGEVVTVRLDHYFAEPTTVDFLKVDAEGYDLFVLQGYPWEPFPPTVVMCEFEDRKSIPLGYSWRELCDLLVGRGYRLLISEYSPISDYSQDPQWRRFAEYPCDLLDERGNGNIIAVHAKADFELFKRIAAIFSRRYAARGLMAGAQTHDVAHSNSR